MTKQEKDKLEQLLQSKNLDDVNLAGVLIKEKLKLTDENLKLLYSFIELAFDKHRPDNSTILTKFEFMRQLLQGDVHQPDLDQAFGYTTWINYPTNYIGDTMSNSGTITISDITNSGILTYDPTTT